MKKLCRLCLILAALSLLFKGYRTSDGSEGEFKTWIPNTNWDNVQNWASGQAPCPLQNAILGNPLKDSPLAVALRGPTSLQSLSLPINGELIFNKDAELTFFQDRDVVLGKCTEKGDIQFIASTPKMWYNPDNWQVTDIDGNPLSNQTNDILHLEKVPCQYDQVLFPQYNSFNIGSKHPITIATVTINGQIYSQSSFKEYLNSESGAIQFHLRNTSVELTGQTCDDPRGCVCNNSQVKSTICGHVTCGLPQCRNPLEPLGSCCTYCGAVITVKPEVSFKLHHFKAQIMSLKTKFVENGRLVQVSILRVNDTIQVFFTDSTNGEQAQRLADQVSDQISGSSDFTIIKRFQSGRSTHSGARKDNSKSLGLALGLGIGLLLLFIIVFAVFMYRRETRMRNHSLHLIEDQNMIELQDMPPSQDIEEQQNKGLTYKNLEFDKLMYKSKRKKTFENPLYESASEENLTRDI